MRREGRVSVLDKIRRGEEGGGVGEMASDFR